MTVRYADKNTTKSRINTYNAVLRVTESKSSMYKNSNRWYRNNVKGFHQAIKLLILYS